MDEKKTRDVGQLGRVELDANREAKISWGSQRLPEELHMGRKSVWPDCKGPKCSDTDGG